MNYIVIISIGTNGSVTYLRKARRYPYLFLASDGAGQTKYGLIQILQILKEGRS